MEKITRENIDKYTYVIEGKIPDKPIDDHFGEGFGFDLDGKHYETKPSLDRDGKLDVIVNITSWIGIVSYAQHYYARMTAIVHNSNGNGTISGYMGGIEIPEENKTLTIELGRPLTEEENKEINNPESSLYLYEPFGRILRFNTREDCLEVIHGVFDALFDKEKCNLHIIG